MGEIIYPNPVKLIFSVISSKEKYFEDAFNCLRSFFGKIDLMSPYQEFDFTDYYKQEMGGNLKQILISFDKLIKPERLAQIKIDSNQLEISLSNLNKNTDSKKINRSINLDPGYITLSKFILASTKNGPARIYLDNGIYAEITLRYIKKSFRAMQWTYRNYSTDLYIDFLNKLREEYKKQLDNIR